MIAGARQRTQSVTRDWNMVQDLIDGVCIKDIRHVPKPGGYVTEIFRRDWQPTPGLVDQVFQVVLNPGHVSAWHMHANTSDRLMVAQGLMKVVLYDARRNSPSYRRINEFRIGTIRPALISIPPGVWHGVQNIHTQPSVMVNIVDAAYRYENPDHWALPVGTRKIPYRFEIPAN